MQRSVEQRHSPKRRVSARRHPHAKTFGFTARQRPFIFVLVANWLFSLTFFLGAKLVWHWQPEAWGIAVYWANRLRGRRATLIEYKGAEPRAGIRT